MLIMLGTYAAVWIISICVLAYLDVRGTSRRQNIYQCSCGMDYRVAGNIGLLMILVALLPFSFLVSFYIALKMKKHKQSCLVKIVEDVTHVA